MLVYSQRYLHLTQVIEKHVAYILSHEVGLKVTRGRFWNKNKTYSYPLSIVIYNHKSCLGYFDAEFLELGFHSSWAYRSLEELKDVIRHELAHYLVFIEHGPGIEPHGQEFKKMCLSLNWDKNVYRAAQEVDMHLLEAKEEDKLRKIQKLLALSSSSNSYEAEQALLKARELMIKTDLDTVGSEDEVFFLKRVLKHKVVSAKMRAIAKICETFFVSCVFLKTKEASYLEILGQYQHVQIGEYVANYLDQELEHIYQKAKQKSPELSGSGAKNAFFLGVAKGFIEKTQQGSLAEKSFEKALVALDRQLCVAKNLAYKKLRSLHSYNKSLPAADLLGQSCGKNLSIKPALDTKSAAPCLLIQNSK